MLRIRLASCMPECSAFLYRGIARQLAEHGIPATLVEEGSASERERALDRGDIDVLFIGAVAYAKRLDRAPGSVELLAAPVMKGARYKQRPIAFSDVVVRRDAGCTSLAELRGASCALAVGDTHAGCGLSRFHSERLGPPLEPFARIHECSSYQNALRSVVDGVTDAAAIDSAALDLELRLRPDLGAGLRTVQTFGPDPAPVVVARTSLSEAQRLAVRQALLRLHEMPSGRTVLSEALVDRFVVTRESEYDPLRRAPRQTERAATLRVGTSAP